MKKIVTHLNPDLDAVVSVWLLKRFLPGWEEARVEFVAASQSTKANQEVDQDPNVLWVDVGRGKLDHHQTGEYLSASKLCLDFILEQRKGQELSPLEKKALVELTEVVTQVDNARELNWPEAKESRYWLYLHDLLFGLKNLGETDHEVVEFGFRALDAVFLNLKNKIRAEEELTGGQTFQTPWGQAMGVETGNDLVLRQGEVQGYVLVIRKDPETGGIRIFARPDSKVDLTEAYNKVRELDPESDWFLHASKKLLLNQAQINPDMKPTKLSLEEMMEILK